jgi:hypothetical protein
VNIEKTPMHQLLLDNGFDWGWALSKEVLLVWEHDEDPPAPLTRPKASDDLAG